LRLVRDSWVGSTGDATALLREVFNLRDSDADLVLAVDEPIEPVTDVARVQETIESRNVGYRRPF